LFGYILNENEIDIEFSQSLKHYIIDQAFNVEFGARPIKRFIQKNIETYLAHKIIENKIETKNHYLLDYENNQIVLK